MDAIEIPIKISGIGRVNREINEVGKRLANLSQGGTGNVGGGGSGGRGRGSGSGGPSFANGPMQQLQRAQMQFRNAWKWGGRNEKVDAGLALQAAQAKVQKALASAPMPKVPVPNVSSPAAKSAPTLGQRVQSAFMTSRIGAGGGLMPLVNKLMAISPVLTVAAGGITLLGRAAQNAADSINAFRASQLTSGGTGAQTALLSSLGLSPQLARSFGQRIATDPMAAGYAARAGIYNPGGEIFGDTNTATNLLKMADALRRMGDVDALRVARITGTEELLKFRDISTETFQQLRKDAEQTARIKTPEQVRAAAEFEVQMIRLGTAFDDLKVQLASGLIPIITTVVGGIANILRWLNSEVLVNGAGTTTDIFGNRYKNTGMKNPQVEAQDRNTAALRELAGILKDGIYGGGDRARGAIPAGWTGQWYDKWSKNAIGLGAFEL